MLTYIMRKEKINWLLLLVLYLNFSYSQELVPPIQNFSPQDYGAASQNWDIALDEEGVAYVANNQGLLVFDGINWELLTLDKESVIRSVYPHKGKIFTGSYQEFGYWEVQDKGCLVYNSLNPLMTDFDFQSEDFWDISSIGEVIYFRSFAAVYKFENNRISRLENTASRAMEVFKDKLVIAHSSRGLLEVSDEGEFNKLAGNSEILDGVELIDIEAAGDTLLLGSRNALYVYHDEEVKKLENNKLNMALANFELNHIAYLNQEEIVIGTIKNGILHFDLTTGEIRNINRKAGLQNNTVLSIFENRNRLWLAMDKGIDVIDLNAPLRFYSDNTGELGAVYDVELYQGSHYLASNTGVYKLENGKLSLIEGAGDHTWNLEVIDEVLYANHNRGTFSIQGDEFIPVDAERGSFTIKSIPTSNKLMIADYTGLSIYDPKNEIVNEIPGVDFPIKQIVFEDENTVWAAHAYEGLFKIEFGDSAGVAIERIESLDGSSNFNSRVYKVNNQVLIYVGDQWYRFNPFKERIEKFDQLEEYNSHRLIHKNEDYVFVNSTDGSIVITDLKGQKLVIPPEDLQHRLVKTNENITILNDSIALISLNDGFAYINFNKLKDREAEKWISRPYIKDFSDDVKNYSLGKTPVVPYKHGRNITIKVGLPLSDAAEMKYLLKGEERLSGNVNSGILNFRNLEDGNYKLELIAIGENGLSQTGSFAFRIASPWYLSVWMKVLYAVLIIALVFLIFLLNRQKLRKHQLKLEEKFEKEHQERLNKLEKERLMNEIDLKRKELANTTMIAAKKNEVLMEIQGELNKDKTKFSNQYRLKHIMNKINKAVKSKDEWQIFETNFNEVHEDFFKDLLEKYPRLTSKDLKLCSYLKMNLSSKEIAPLMGISVRGVEVHRYRLRKKMALESDVNLSKFLIQNF